MVNRQLHIYLNDHLAGSGMILQVLEFLERSPIGKSSAIPLHELRKEIEADRQELESLMAQLDVDKSATRQAMGWLGEKLSELKLRIDGPAELNLLEALDTVSLGIEGQVLLWQAIAAAAEWNPLLRKPNFDRMMERAKDHRRKIEEIRVPAARDALAGASKVR
jgi:hypothetical protein